jgi:uncharacterized protein
MIERKTNRLDNILKELGSVVVAFSGGVDSSFLLFRAKTLNLINLIGVTIRTPYIPNAEIQEAVIFCEKHGIKHHILDLPFPESLQHNPLDRCYICKHLLFTRLVSFAEDNGYQYVIEGTNADDSSDYRPGLKALKELNVKSPLLEAGLTKEEIRDLLRKEGLTVWDKPPMACLMTRIPYNTKVEDEILRKVEKAEYYLMEKGCPGTRVRAHGDLARIECLPGYFEKFIHNPEKEQIIKHLKEIGFRYISLDLEGYKSGSMNPEINDK